MAIEIYKKVKITFKKRDEFIIFFLDGLETGRARTTSQALEMAKKEIDNYEINQET